MANTEILQGRFTSAGVITNIPLPIDVDWMEVTNQTTMIAGGAGTGVLFNWQRGFADDTGIEYQKEAVTGSMNNVWMANNGFTRIDTSQNPDGAINANLTSISGAAPPIVATGVTAPLVAGDSVRFVNVPGAQQFGGVEFTVDTIVAGVSFRLPFAPTIVATGAVVGSYYPVRWGPIYYPRRRFITSITQAANAVVVMTVTHGFTVGQRVRFQVPAGYGMTEINNLTGTITAVNLVTNAITTDIDSTLFTAFAWPLTAAVPLTHAQVVPVGEDSTLGVTLDDATDNVSNIFMRLATGVDSPAGVLNDVIYWRAGRSFNVNNL